MSDEVRSGLIQDVKDLEPRSAMVAGDTKDSGAGAPDQKPGADRDAADQDADGSDADGSDKADSDASDASDADGSDAADADGTDKA